MKEFLEDGKKRDHAKRVTPWNHLVPLEIIW
jgi:hypothetical protein